MLGDNSTGQRRLGFAGFNFNYTDIYIRCCEEEVDNEWPQCKCPKRTSTETPPSWASSWLGTQTYLEKWTEQCSVDGWLYKQANTSTR